MMNKEKIEMFKKAYEPWESETFFDRQEKLDRKCF